MVLTGPLSLVAVIEGSLVSPACRGVVTDVVKMDDYSI